METPLDMLSRAASMVETSTASTSTTAEEGEALNGHMMNARGSPPHDLPSRSNKYRRLHDRQGLASTLSFDNHHAEKYGSKKTAGTQTMTLPGYQQYAVAATEGGNYPVVSSARVPPHYAPFHDSMATANTSVSMTTQQQQQQGYSPFRSHDSEPDTDSDGLDRPLNLTVHSSSPNRQQEFHSRPSVITLGRATQAPNFSPHNLSPNSIDHSKVLSEDPAIEEHFRRSLGNHYTELSSSPRSSSSPGSRTSPEVQGSRSSPEVKVDQAVSVTGSVDDHFAKSLGATWTRIKAQQDSTPTDNSVDDHFAKALGDTWLRIKAQKGTGEPNGRSPPLRSSPPIVGLRKSPSPAPSAPTGPPIAAPIVLS